MPENFANLSLDRQVALIHDCHEMLIEDRAKCAARQVELSKWVEIRVQKEGRH